MEKFDESKLIRMKKHLAVIRRVAGWTAEELGDHIGVKRQTISSLEKNPDYAMTKTQYIAIRAVLYCEMEENHNQTLRDIVDILVVRDDLAAEDVRRVNAVVDEEFQKNGRAVNPAAIISGLSVALGALGFAVGGVPTAAIVATQMAKRVGSQSQNKKERKVT